MGEEFADGLDAIAEQLGRRYASLELDPDSLVALILRKQRFIETTGEWPDFAGELRIGVRIPQAQPQVDTTH